MIINKIIIVISLLFGAIFIANSQSYSLMDVDCYTQEDVILKNAFAGGLNCPQFNEIDMDLDGVMDLLIFDREGNSIIPYLNKNDDYEYAPQYKSIFPKFKRWVRLRDYNDDGIMDIFCYNIEAPLDGIEIYTGKVVDNKLSFDKITESNGFYEIIYYLLQGNYYNMEVISSDIPDIVDVDNDGDLDIITFTGDGGYVRYYKNTSVEDEVSLDSPRYKLEDLCWGKFYESGFSESIKLSDDPNKCKEPEFQDGSGGNNKTLRHAGSTVTVYDDDNDGDMEIIIGDLTAHSLTWLDNGGDSEKAWMTGIDSMFPSYDKKADMFIFLAGFIQDIDHDGNDDLIVAPNYPSASANLDNVWFYKNNAENGQHDFEFIQNDVFSVDMFDFGSLSNPSTCDYNQDGKLDILVGTYGRFRPGMNPDAKLILLENTSTEDQVSFKIVDDNYLGFDNYNNTYFSYAPTFGDLDGDGDDDLIVGAQNGSMIYCMNTAGEGNQYAFAAPVFEYKGIDVGENVKPQIIDLNRDGLLDLVLGERSQNASPFNNTHLGNLNYFQNQGTLSEPIFDSNVNALPNTPVLGRVVTKEITTFNGSAAPFFIDTGSDFLLYVGSETGKIKLYNGVSADSIYGSFNLLEDNVSALNEGGRSTIVSADLNDDGVLEFLVGNVRGGLAIYGSNLKLDGTVNQKELLDFFVEVYPNPASDKIRINLGSNIAQEVLIYNQLGQMVLHELGTFSTKDVDVSSLSKGVYFVEIRLKDKRKVMKLVKGE